VFIHQEFSLVVSLDSHIKGVDPKGKLYKHVGVDYQRRRELGRTARVFRSIVEEVVS
jgi:hypothetical protein